MDRIRIEGGARLEGAIPISGAKNAALPLMAAALLTGSPLVLSNVPKLGYVGKEGNGFPWRIFLIFSTCWF